MMVVAVKEAGSEKTHLILVLIQPSAMKIQSSLALRCQGHSCFSIVMVELTKNCSKDECLMLPEK